VTDALAKVSDQLRAVAIVDLGVLRAHGHGATRDVVGVGQAQHGRPLFELLVATLRADQGVAQAVDDLHARALAGIAGIGVAHVVGPPLGRVLQALRARLVGPHGCRRGVAAGEAGKGRARVSRASIEDVRVRPDHDVGHHGARRRAHDKNLVLVAAEPVERVADHTNNTRRVSRPAVGQGSGVVDVPAVAVRRRLRVDDDEAVAVGVRWQVEARVELLGRAAARVELDAGQ